MVNNNIVHTFNKIVMDNNQFIFNKFVTGKNFLGRASELKAFCNLVGQGENVAIFEPPKTGKTSFIMNAFYNMSVSGASFTPVVCSLLPVRSRTQFALRFGSAVLNAFGKTYEEHSTNVGKYLSDTHFVFDPEAFVSSGDLLSANWDIDDNDLKAVFKLPYRLARDKSSKAVVVLEEFQNINFSEDPDSICGLLHSIFSTLEDEFTGCCAYVFTGSEVNAMKDIFTQRKLFYRRVSVLHLEPLATRDIIDHSVKCFLSSGKVLDRELMIGICHLFKDNIYYINHFCFICDSLSKGYIMEATLKEALETLISIYEPGFVATMNSLTNFQMSLLRAIIDGHDKFSSADVIARYGLNSSANVRRLKDALCKKEIITFDDNDNPLFLDPLLEYWVRKYYFKIAE